MTLQELNAVFRLKKQLEKNAEMLESLRAAAAPSSPALTGMPHAPGVKDKVADLAIEIAELEESSATIAAEIHKRERAVEDFIGGIENAQTRLIFRLRFLRALSWAQVAAVIGGRNTEEGVKTVCYRFLESCNGPQRPDA